MTFLSTDGESTRSSDSADIVTLRAVPRDPENWVRATHGAVNCLYTGRETNMPRNYVRKSLAAGKTEDSLADLLNRSDGHGRPKRMQFAQPAPSHLRRSFTNLAMWLDELAKTDESGRYSTLLQVWLHLNGFVWPKGVFKTDLTSPGRGRPRSDLGAQALLMHKPNVVGWMRIAKALVPEKYKENPNQAADYIRDLARTAAKAANRAGPLESELRCGRVLLGIEAPKDDLER